MAFSIKVQEGPHSLLSLSDFVNGTYNSVTVALKIAGPAGCVDFILRARKQVCGPLSRGPALF